MKATFLAIAIAVSLQLAPSAARSDRDNRLQVSIHEPDTPLGSQSGEPRIVSTRWSDGDLQVLLTQAAPCGNTVPVNPVWEKAGSTIILRYDWHRMPDATPPRGDRCLKHVQAWVYHVPNAPYTVLVSDSVPRF